MTIHDLGGVTMEESIERSPEGLKPPAVTLIAFQHSFYGWKNSSLHYTDNYKIQCEGAHSSEDFVSCVKTAHFLLRMRCLQLIKDSSWIIQTPRT